MEDAVRTRAEALRASLNGSRERPPEWTEAYDLIAEPEPDRAWVIEDFVERQGRVLLAGAEGGGKSLLALTVAVQAAAGVAVLDQFPHGTPLRVVYFDLEMARSSTRRRLRSLKISAHLPPKALYLVMRPDGLDLRAASERRELQERLVALEPDLVIIDPLYKLLVADTKEEKDLRPLIIFLDRLRVEVRCALLIIHHLRKRQSGEARRGRDSSDVYGSALLLRWPETVMFLEAQTLRVEKDRDATFEGQKTFPVVHGGTWPISLGDPKEPPDEAVMAFLREAAPASANEVCRAVRRQRQRVFEALARLEAAGRIARVDTKWVVKA